MNRRGMTLIEIIYASGISLVVLAIGFRAYTGITRIDDVQSHRESASLAVQTAMDVIKRDVRAGTSVSGSGQSMSITGPSGRIAYRNVSGGLQRVTPHSRRLFKGALADFSSLGGNGVHVTVSARDTIHRRPIRVEVSSFVRPRNR